VVWTVRLSLSAVLPAPSAVPVEATWAVLSRTVPSATPAPTVTWTMKLVVPPLTTLIERLQVTAWPLAEQSLLVELPESGPVILTGDACYWHEHADKERVPGVVWNPTLALHSLRKLKTIARLTRGQIFPGHDPIFWETVKQAPDAYR